MDEGFSVFMGRTDAASFWRFVRGGEVNMVLYYGLFRIWLHFGTSELWIRFFSAIWGVATIPVVYALGKRLCGGVSGGVAALLFAAHPSEVAYAQEVRGYSIAVFLIAVSCLLFLRSVEESKSWRWAGYVTFSALAVYAHLFTIFVIAAQWAWLLLFLRSRMWKLSILTSGAALALSLVPLISIVLVHYHQAADWIPPLTVSGFLEVWSFLTLPKWRILLYLSLWIVAVGTSIFGRQHWANQWQFGFTACWLFLPVALTLGISLYKPMLAPRFLLVCLPASVLLATCGLTRLPRSVATVAFGVLAIASFTSVLSYYRHLGWKEDWRGATAYLVSHCEAGDGVVIVPAYGRFTFDYYREISPGPRKVLVYGQLNPSKPFLPSGVGHRTWLIISAVGSRLPGMREVLQDLTSNAKPSSSVLETHHFNSIEVLLVR